MLRIGGIVIARSEATWRSMGRLAPYVPLHCFAIARQERRASFNALWLAMTIAIRRWLHHCLGAGAKGAFLLIRASSFCLSIEGPPLDPELESDFFGASAGAGVEGVAIG